MSDWDALFSAVMPARRDRAAALDRQPGTTVDVSAVRVGVRA